MYADSADAIKGTTVDDTCNGFDQLPRTFDGNDLIDGKNGTTPSTAAGAIALAAGNDSLIAGPFDFVGNDGIDTISGGLEDKILATATGAT